MHRAERQRAALEAGAELAFGKTEISFQGLLGEMMALDSKNAPERAGDS